MLHFAVEMATESRLIPLLLQPTGFLWSIWKKRWESHTIKILIKPIWQDVEVSRDALNSRIFMVSTTEAEHEQYFVDLPFREENPVLPNNCCVAEQGFWAWIGNLTGMATLNRSILISDMLVQGYAEIMVMCGIFPHHLVHYPTKGKLRNVFDYGDTNKITLKCRLLQGSDLIQLGKQHITIMADIHAMCL